MSNRNTVFISYTHANTDWLNRLKRHLKPLERDFSMVIWDDKKIQSGDKWRDKIGEAIASAKVAVLLVSPDFLSSDFIHSDELPPLLLAAEKEGAIILPLIVSPCRFSRTKSLSVFQAVNNPNRPLTAVSKNQQEKVLDELAQRIESALKDSLPKNNNAGDSSPVFNISDKQQENKNSDRNEKKNAEAGSIDAAEQMLSNQKNPFDPWKDDIDGTIIRINEAMNESSSSILYWQLAVVLARKNLISDAELALKKGDEKSNGEANIRKLYRAYVQLKQRDWKASEVNIRSFLKSDETPYETAIAFDLLGQCLKQQNKIDDSIASHLRAIQVKNKIGDLLGCSISLGNVGRTYLYTCDYNKAIEKFSKNLDIVNRIGNKKARGIVLNNLAEAYICNGQFSIAKTLLKNLLDEALFSQEDYGFANLLLAELSVFEGDIEMAKGCLEIAKSNFERAGSSGGIYLSEEIDGLISMAQGWRSFARMRFDNFKEKARITAGDLFWSYRLRRRAYLAALLMNDDYRQFINEAKSIIVEKFLSAMPLLEIEVSAFDSLFHGSDPSTEAGSIWLQYWAKRLPVIFAKKLPFFHTDTAQIAEFLEFCLDFLILLADAELQSTEYKWKLERKTGLGIKVGLLREASSYLNIKGVVLFPEQTKLLNYFKELVEIRNIYAHPNWQKNERNITEEARSLFTKIVKYISDEIKISIQRSNENQVTLTENNANNLGSNTKIIIEVGKRYIITANHFQIIKGKFSWRDIFDSHQGWLTL